MGNIQIIFICVFLAFSIILNIFTYLRFKNSDFSVISDNSKIEAQLILIDRKLSDIKSDIKDITTRVEGLENLPVMELDETASYVKSGMNIQEIAKKTNKSIKEVELMLKMRGLI
ncbi:hypothetical protein [Peptoanaerobacter stomatis]|jgi:hypothetical protein|uniref:DUF2802 domain-containing protein n=1 Tax=Peptoanaerobacter stomatis TaxID=796937 RepID=G9WY86_9FIRM|nr:hypothetical protein [Peptoanaerobacter stomatis]EHL16590.1 hypothetical protein HMPREF9629_01137 [Peptoanaerobacter stomatis]